MQLSPSFDEALLPLRHQTSHQGHGRDREDCDILLIIGMEMRHMVAFRRLTEHPDDDPVETRDFRHEQNLTIATLF